MLRISPIPAFNDNYIWLMENTDNACCAVVDPGDATPVLNVLAERKMQCVAIIATHHHWDHTGGIAELLNHVDVPVYGPAQDGIAEVSVPLSEGDTFTIDDLNLRFNVLDIPAHTRGHIAVYTSDFVFTGDTLFLAGCGRIFEGDATQMFHALQKILTLPEDTLVYCGHEYTESNLEFALLVEPGNKDISSRLDEVRSIRMSGEASIPAPLSLEKKTNPFLRCDMREVVQAAEDYSGKVLKDPIEVLSVIREWKNAL